MAKLATLDVNAIIKAGDRDHDHVGSDYALFLLCRHSKAGR